MRLPAAQQVQDARVGNEHAADEVACQQGLAQMQQQQGHQHYSRQHQCQQCKERRDGCSGNDGRVNHA